ncbi:MAG TPA: hypothetical protein VJ111_06845 [Chitinophagaceae bacterium]|nr:hypothetical protein [Chitinophagaceae bacterium]
MKRAVMLIGFIVPFMTKAQVEKFDAYPVYTGNDLGLIYTPQQSLFRIWSPRRLRQNWFCIRKEQVERHCKQSACKKANREHGSLH